MQLAIKLKCYVSVDNWIIHGSGTQRNVQVLKRKNEKIIMEIKPRITNVHSGINITTNNLYTA